jgi:hypothetical protein
MNWKVYFDRPQALIADYHEQINSFVGYAYPNWGGQNRGVWAKGEYGEGSLRADHFSILDTQGVWQVPNTAVGTTGSKTSAANGWISKALDFKTLEEVYTMMQGIQYGVNPLNIVETQFAIAGITTPVVSNHVLSVLEEPLIFYSEPLVVEPEKTIAWDIRTRQASSALSAEKIRIVGQVVGQHHELIQQTTSSGELT